MEITMSQAMKCASPFCVLKLELHVQDFFLAGRAKKSRENLFKQRSSFLPSLQQALKKTAKFVSKFVCEIHEKKFFKYQQSQKLLTNHTVWSFIHSTHSIYHLVSVSCPSYQVDSHNFTLLLAITINNDRKGRLLIMKE